MKHQVIPYQKPDKTTPLRLHDLPPGTYIGKGVVADNTAHLNSNSPILIVSSEKHKTVTDRCIKEVLYCYLFADPGSIKWLLPVYPNITHARDITPISITELVIAETGPAI